jgi:hypothetical protein
LLVTLVAAAPAVAMDEGVPDREGHPSIGVLSVDPDGSGAQPPGLLCTGSVISDSAFLTAAHCIAAFPDPGVVWSVSLQPGTPTAPVATPGVFPAEFPFAMTVPTVPARAVAVHPRFDPERLAHDVAVALFPAGTFAGVAPVELPRARLLNRLGRQELRRRSFRLVGYGTDPEWGNGPPQFVLEGYRQTATAPFLRLTARQLKLDGEARSTGQGSLCYGDSGSPQLLGDSNRAVSLFSRHDDDCSGPLLSQRLDTAPERRFLSRYAELP